MTSASLQDVQSVHMHILVLHYLPTQNRELESLRAQLAAAELGKKQAEDQRKEADTLRAQLAAAEQGRRQAEERRAEAERKRREAEQR